MYCFDVPLHWRHTASCFNQHKFALVPNDLYHVIGFDTGLTCHKDTRISAGGSSRSQHRA